MRSLILCSLLFLTTAPALRADDTTPTKTDTKTVSENIYRIAPQDVLDVTVQDHIDLSKTAVVLPDGTISYPYVGEFKASGLTLREISDKITSALSKEISNPQVTVTIKSLHERQANQVSIWFEGAARTAGKFTLKEGERVLDLLIEAGGLAANPNVSYSAHIIRNSENMPVDLSKILSATDPKANVLLAANDILVVRQLIIAPNLVDVLGEVSKTGPYALPKDGSLIAILSAAAPTPRAALSQATITHEGKVTTVDLSGYLLQGRIPENIKLEAGDTLFIPQNRMTYSVYGAVTRQGIVPYPDTQRLNVLEALSMAGGQAQDANMKNVAIVHPVKGAKPQITYLNLEDAFKKGDTSKNVALLPGDTLFISSNHHRGTFGLSTVLSALPFIGFFGL